MRSMKTSGGLTRGRGMTDVQRTLWLLGSPICASFNESIQCLTGVQFHTSEQHKEVGGTRLKKDYADAAALTNYLVERSPFTKSEELFCLETGEVADCNVNTFEAKQIGEQILAKMVDIPVLQYKYTKKDQVVIMKTKSSVTIDDEVLHVDPQLLFQRLLATVKVGNTAKLEEAFSYELSTVPVSLFGEDFLMREANKPQLGDAILKFTGVGRGSLPEKVTYVIDGGWLMFRIPNWRKGTTFDAICQLYIAYVIQNYGINSTVVFDGGYDLSSTKDTTHLRRTKGKKGKQVRLNSQLQLTMKKEDFLLHKSNKQHFLEMLTAKMVENGLSAIQDSGDADRLIVSTALDLSKTHPVAIIGDDTDLLAITLQHATNEHEIYITAPPKSKSLDKPKLWDIAHMLGKLGENCNCMGLVHAILGCDTTSRVQNVGKRSAFLKLLTDTKFKQIARQFYDSDSKPEDIICAGEKLLLLIYGAKENTLDKLRFSKFGHKIATSTVVVTPDSLCPTSDAAGLHSLRVYHQVQAWMGNDIPPLNWGWYMRKDNHLMPIMMSSPPAPQSLLKVIRCTCTTDCQGRCTCYKFQLKCTYLCCNCKGVSCLNCEDAAELIAEHST